MGRPKAVGDRAFHSVQWLATCVSRRKDDWTYQRRPEQWTNTESNNHERDRKRNYDIAHMELGHDVLEVTSNDSTRKGDLDDGESAYSGDIWVKKE